MSILKRLSRIVPLAVGAGLLLPVPARARLAQPDQDFLAEETGQLSALTDSLAAGTESPSATMNAVRTLLAARADAVTRLGAKLPLTSLDGIETLDLLDDAVVRDLHSLVADTEVDTSSLGEDEAFLFAEAMVGVPPLGDAPVGFMIVDFAEFAVAAADSVEEAAHIGENQAALLGLSAIRHATDLYLSLDQDLISQDRRASFRQSSILYRLRCPKDDASYDLASQRNRVLPDRALARLNILVCSVCGDTLEVTFPLVLPTALQQRTPEQHLEKKPHSPGPAGQVEP